MSAARRSLPDTPAKARIDAAEAAHPLSWQTQQWLDTLPHATAIITLDDAARLLVLSSNDLFRKHALEAAQSARDSGFSRSCADVLTGKQASVTTLREQGGPSGRIYDVAVRPMPAADGVATALVSMTDRTTLARSEANLRRELLSDSLTGLPNRAGFAEEIEQRLAGSMAEGHRPTMLIIDLARFSRINESVGALAADELILTVACRLRQQIRGDDVLARIGGDEFGVLSMTKIAEQGPEQLAARLLEVFATPFRIGNLSITIDCSIGGIRDVADANALHEADGVDLIRKAQIALKQAKSGEGIAYYEPVALTRLHQRFDRETALREAIEHDEIGLSFQPLVDMQSRRITGFEALARWTSKGERIGPGEFVPIAEESGLIVPLGRRVINRAIATLHEWDMFNGGPVPLTMSINVSPIQLAKDDIVQAFRECLKAHELTGERIVVEITESAMVEQSDVANIALRELTAMGIRIAMDDFGIGYSNIAALQRMPIHTLKIDRSLVAGIDSNNDSLAIVRTIQRLAEALGFRTTAEGIETETVARQVSAIGCTYGQGYLFSRPMDAETAYAAWRNATTN